ncbi:MAG TPA: sugar phosphate isomerase/epimerase [Gemmatimonadaceae bacterium]|nr:sugar phosphate isomerase/epimerase [Gemmatimonadaceae bacterium]
MPLLHRRSFLATLGVLAARALTGARAAARTPPLLERVGLQLYTVRAAMARDVAGTLERVAAIGYREVEFAGYFGVAPRDMRALLARHGLAAPSAHVPFEALRDDWPRALEAAATVGHTWVTIPWIPEEERRTLDDWKRVAALFTERAAEAKAAGLRFAYHNHDFEFRRIAGMVPLDVLLAETDRALVEFELDLYWVVRGGHEPVAYLRRHAGRFPMVHVKDSAGPPEHRMVDLGQGTIDFPRVLAAAVAQGTRHFFVEHDQPADPVATARAGHRYLTALQRT